MSYTQQIQQHLIQYKKEIAREAEQLMTQTMPPLTEELFSLFETTGDRLQYENVYFARRRFLTVFGIQALVEKVDAGEISARTMGKLTQVLEEICGEECWALPAHLSRKYPQWRNTIDLFASETVQTLAELADRLREDLPEALYWKIRENAENRILNQFFGTAPEQFGWEGADHNWNAVITGSIGSAAIHLWGAERNLDREMKRIRDSLLGYIGGFAQDGTCMEGSGYYTYGMSYFVNFAQELLEYSKGKYDLLRGDWGQFRAGEADKREKIAAFQSKCFFPDGTTACFSDGNRLDQYCLGLQLALKKRFPGMALPSIAGAQTPTFDHCWRFVFRKLDILETEAWLAEDHAQETSGGNPVAILPDAQWCIAGAKNAVGMACKGGYNQEPHNHNDVGSLIYEGLGTAFLADLGAGLYTRQSFSEARYDIFCNGSLGHNVPILDGEGQKFGKEYRCCEFAAQVEDELLRVSMDFSGAYGRQAGTVRRELEFGLNFGMLRVADHFRNAEGTENLITQCVPVVQGNRVILRGEAGAAVLTVEQGGAITVQEHDHSDHWGKLQKVYSIRWNADGGESVFAIALEKVEL